MLHELPELAERGYVVLGRCDLEIPEAEYLDLEYRDWKSGGDTNFAPIASAFGAIECAGFWDHGKPDKDGVWTANAAISPTLVEWTVRVGADYGRVRVIKLEPNVMPDVERWIHLDDNNRLNPDGTGRVVRAWLQLTDDPDSCMILRTAKDDRDGEVRIPLRAGHPVRGRLRAHVARRAPPRVPAALRPDRQLRVGRRPPAVDRRQPRPGAGERVVPG